MLNLGMTKLSLPPEELGFNFEQEYAEEHLDVFKEQEQQPVTVEASTESIDMSYRARMSSFVDSREYFDDCCCDAGPRRKPIEFIKNIDKETGKCEWIFFFTEFDFGKLNDLVNKLFLVKPQDSVFIHGPACLYTDDAEVIVSALQNCASKDITISSPYILNAGAAYILTAAKKIVSSACAVMHIELPTVGAGGKVTDAKNGMESDVYRRMHILNTLVKEGFINEAQLRHIVDEQGQIVLYGTELASIIAKYNSKGVVQTVQSEEPAAASADANGEVPAEPTEPKAE